MCQSKLKADARFYIWNDTLLWGFVFCFIWGQAIWKILRLIEIHNIKTDTFALIGNEDETLRKRVSTWKISSRNRDTYTPFAIITWGRLSRKKLTHSVIFLSATSLLEALQVESIMELKELNLTGVYTF